MRRDALILLVMPAQQREPLLAKLEAFGSGLMAVKDCAEARSVFEARLPIQVVVSAVTLPDGDWANVLRDLQASGSLAQLVVCAELPDVKLWCDALDEGAYDLIVDSYSEPEIHRIIWNAACRPVEPRHHARWKA